MLSRRLVGAFANSSRLASVAPPKFKPNQGTGDSGQSSLYTSERRWKDDEVFEALGTIDELSSHLGYSPFQYSSEVRLRLCRSRLERLGLFSESEFITQIQCRLQDVGSHVATPLGGSERMQKRTELSGEEHRELETLTEAIAKALPPLTTFILPGGGEGAGGVQVARAVCRRAERRVASVVRKGEADKSALRYLNRYPLLASLSDTNW